MGRGGFMAGAPSICPNGYGKPSRAAKSVICQQSLNVGGFPFPVTADNAEMVKAKALSRLMKELDAGVADPTSYSEDEVYHMLGVEK